MNTLFTEEEKKEVKKESWQVESNQVTIQVTTRPFRKLKKETDPNRICSEDKTQAECSLEEIWGREKREPKRRNGKCENLNIERSFVLSFFRVTCLPSVLGKQKIMQCQIKQWVDYATLLPGTAGF